MKNQYFQSLLSSSEIEWHIKSRSQALNMGFMIILKSI